MKYPLIAARVAREIWLTTPEVHQAIHAAVFHGQTFTALPAGKALYGEDGNDDFDGDEAEMTGGRTAIIQVFGVLGKHLDSMEMACGGCSIDRVASLLTAADKDPDCETIVLMFNSPGGAAMGIPELAAKIKDIGTRKNVIAYTDGLCCSGALWLASQCDTFLASPSSIIGSVGCCLTVPDESRKLELEGVKMQSIYDGKFKMTGSSFRPLTQDEIEMLTIRVQSIGAAFRAALTSARAIAPEDMQGQAFTGEEACAKGFVDGLANDLDEVLEIAAS